MRSSRAVLAAASLTPAAGGVLTSGTHEEHDGAAVVACRLAVEAALRMAPSADRLACRSPA